jgi:hypothetical protein
MSEITRICSQCGQSTAIETRYCPHCGYDSEAGLPAPRAANLPVIISRAALPVLAGAASLAIRAIWQLAKSRLTAAAVDHTAHLAAKPKPVAPPAAPDNISPTQRPGKTIHIRSSWAVGDANGIWQQGVSEHTIKVE